LLYFLLTISLLLGESALEVQLTRVDESTVDAVVHRWDRSSVEVQVAGQPVETLPLGDVLRIDLQHRGQPPAAPPPVEVQLTDGTRLAAEQFTTAAQRCTIEGTALRRPGTDRPVLEPPLDVVRSVRLQPLSADRPALQTQWREILATEAAADLIVIRKPDTERLTFVEGALGEVRRDRVQFLLDGQTLDVDRQRVFGLVYFRSSGDRHAASSAPLVTATGARLPVQSVWLEGDTLRLGSELLGETQVPLAAVRSVDYSRDRLQYLSDLEPVRAEWTPLAGAAPAGRLFASVARDRGFYDAELAVESPPASLAPEETTSAGLGARVVYPKGLAIRSRTELVYRVPGGFEWFRATAAIDPETQATGQVELTVRGDGRRLWSGTITGTSAPQELECPVDGVRELTILVDYGSTGGIDIGIGDNLHLAAARFTK